MRRLVAVSLTMVLAAGIIGCSRQTGPAESEPQAGAVSPASGSEAVAADPVSVAPSWVTPVTDANFGDLILRYHPNELGQVLILEYHHLGDQEERWTRRWDNFRKDLETLYAKGYRDVSLLDYLSGNMALPAGTSPVIFTFDDGVISQLKLIKRDGRWEADPQSAVGILLDFKKSHPDFGSAASFYVKFTPVPFEEKENWQDKLRFLRDNGFEVGNHSYTHDDLSILSDEGVRRSLAMNVKLVREALPDYDGSTLSLPFGNWPKNKQLAITGEYDGVTYKHRAVLLVGADPVDSPYDKRLNVMALPRVQAIDSEFARWYPVLDKTRYISDGDPNTVVIPGNLQQYLNPDAVKGKTVRPYSPGPV